MVRLHPRPEPLLEVRGVTKSFGALVGENGAG